MALENLSPIVREERLLAGEDLEPANRLEYFLKQAGAGDGGSVPTPTAADTGKVLTANNGEVEWDTINEVPAGASGEEGFYLSLNNSLEPVWKQSVAVFNVTVSNEVYTCDTVWQIIKNRFMSGLTYVQIENDICAVVGVTEYPEGNEYGIRVAMFNSLIDLGTNTPLGYPSIDLS